MHQNECSRIAGRKNESGDYFPFLNGFPSRLGDDLSELVWENGQVSVQGQSSRPSFANNLPCWAQNEAVGDQKAGMVHGILPAVPSSESDLGLNSELAPWLDNFFDDAMEHEYGPHRLLEVSADMEHGLSGQNGSELGLSNLKAGEKCPPFSYKPYLLWSSQNQQKCSVSRPGVSDDVSNQTEFLFRNQDQGRDAFTDGWRRKSNSRMVNSPHCCKQKAANLQDPVGIPASGGSNSKNSDTDVHVTSAPEDPSNSMPELTRQVHNQDLSKGTGIGTEKLQLQSPEILEKHISGSEVPVELNVACSSVGSGQGAEVVSLDRKSHLKRKSCDSDDPGRHNNDDDVVYVAEEKHALPRRVSASKRSEVVEVETEHVDGKKPAPVRSTARSKRSRVPEMHNLSERRRRDRINEKMKALQELIPNCNKVDKASMLGEAIEYMKMLQFQVQFMSMGGRLCVQPVMFPQPMYPLLTPFLPMGAGKSPCMVDSRFSVFPASVPQVPHFTCSVTGPGPGASSMFRAPGSGLPVCGHPLKGPPRPSEQRPKPCPINSRQTSIPSTSCDSKQPPPPPVPDPVNPSSKIGVISHHPRQVKVMKQSTRGVKALPSHITS